MEESCELAQPGSSIWNIVKHSLCAVLDLDGCSPPPAAHAPGLRSALLAAAALVVAAVLLAVSLATLAARLMYWLNARHGSRVAKVAAGALKELRSAAPELHPRSRHAWFGARDVDVSYPLLCAACLGYIPPLAPGQTLQSCAACGIVAHDGCVRRTGDACRPLSVPAARPPHFWLTAGTARDDQSAADGIPSRACLYCGEPGLPAGVGELYATEPAWRCACCGVLAHVQCFCAAHPSLPSVDARFRDLLRGDSHSGAAAGLPGQQQQQVGSGVLEGAGGSGASSAMSSPGGTPHASPPRHKRSRSWLSSVADSANEGVGGAAGGEGGGDAGPGQQLRRRRRAISASNVDSLDVCSLGPLGQLVLAPSCVKRARDPAAPSTSFKASPRQQQQQQQQADGRRDGGGRQGKRRGKRQGGGRQGKRRGSSWWRRAFAPRPPQWQDWRVDPLPPQGARPVVVFINVKSGPQLGEDLRQRFLRLLHPLQVVTLPREAPEPALRLFAHVPGLRLLVVGGDGTVGWILSCLDAMAAAARAEGGAWKPPPVAVMPLGTGNDLARCLGWGAGFSAWLQEGAAGVLAEVSQASVAMLDRWDLAVQPAAPPPPVLLPSSLPQLLSPRGGGGAAEGGKGAAPPPPTVRRWNNYLGIGVDAKVALAFHAMREAHPHWFQSQVGNKIAYTGFGAKNIVEGGALNLRDKLRIVCDGEEVEVPPGVEGVLLLSISSYMGGLDLWGTGVDWQPHASRQHQRRRQLAAGPSTEALAGKADPAAAAAAQSQSQSMCDGIVEIVGVYSSWHLGQLTVGLARALRLGRGRRVVLTTREALPMQLDGEPFTQPAAELAVGRRGQALVLRRVGSKPVAAVVRAVEEVLEGAQQSGAITAEQHYALTRDVAARLQHLG